MGFGVKLNILSACARLRDRASRKILFFVAIQFLCLNCTPSLTGASSKLLIMGGDTTLSTVPSPTPSPIPSSTPRPINVPTPTATPSTLPSPSSPQATAQWKAAWPSATGPSLTNPVLTSGPVVTTAPAGAIILNPGDDVAAVIRAAPANSTFYFNAGIYRMQSIVARSHDTYIGALGAVLNGSRVLNFVRSGNYWSATGQTQMTQLNGECEAAYPRCMYAEDLFVDNVPYTQVATLAALTAGNRNWFFDYTANIIYLADSPAGHTVETSVARNAFSGANATQVTIKNFMVEKYAIPMQMGAIGDQHPGTYWQIENNEVRLNHGVGVRIGDYSSAISNHIHHNGEMGMSGSGHNLLIERNEIDHNNFYSGVNCAWECGGTKFSSSQYLVVKLNYSHDNFGDGLWTDVNNIYSTYDGNWIMNNHSGGIHHEVSYDALIQNNRIENNGAANNSWLWSSQIEVVNSQNVEVRNNSVTVASWSSGYEGNAIGIIYQDRSRDSQIYGSHNHVAGNLVHHNDVTFLGTASDGLGTGIACDLAGFNSACPIADQAGNIVLSNAKVYDVVQNRFYSNTYHAPLAGIHTHYFKVLHPTNSATLAGTQALGQEVGSTLVAQ